MKRSNRLVMLIGVFLAIVAFVLVITSRPAAQGARSGGRANGNAGRGGGPRAVGPARGGGRKSGVGSMFEVSAYV